MRARSTRLTPGLSLWGDQRSPGLNPPMHFGKQRRYLVLSVVISVFNSVETRGLKAHDILTRFRFIEMVRSFHGEVA